MNFRSIVHRGRGFIDETADYDEVHAKVPGALNVFTAGRNARLRVQLSLVASRFGKISGGSFFLSVR
jgi:hypothetical protein